MQGPGCGWVKRKKRRGKKNYLKKKKRKYYEKKKDGKKTVETFFLKNPPWGLWAAVTDFCSFSVLFRGGWRRGAMFHLYAALTPTAAAAFSPHSIRDTIL